MKETNMSTKYQPNAVEEGRYDQWVASGVFAPNEDKTAEPYSIVIPPPNVTGKLHLLLLVLLYQHGPYLVNTKYHNLAYVSYV